MKNCSEDCLKSNCGNAPKMTCDDCEDDGENEERPEVPEGVLRGIEDIAEGNTASKENLCDIDESDHPDPELVAQAERVLSLVRATMYPVAHGEAYRLQEMLEERPSEDSKNE
ncbi:hypothetical protein [Haloplanus rubicundus]|uniref:Uncharacterized protein n=1 Tax=Haloplanus rubicundus TaxID=1547898 RepID=A0A345EC17_9EURY|nr:hypothetical protein [Haloplanus rubicundus]AXG09739.1 hypothetical protein DU484_07620 [Haloplanus rubicundus]